MAPWHDGTSSLLRIRRLFPVTSLVIAIATAGADVLVPPTSLLQQAQQKRKGKIMFERNPRQDSECGLHFMMSWKKLQKAGIAFLVEATPSREDSGLLTDGSVISSFSFPPQAANAVTVVVHAAAAKKAVKVVVPPDPLVLP
jgi:hypothetical protein